MRLLAVVKDSSPKNLDLLHWSCFWKEISLTNVESWLFRRFPLFYFMNFYVWSAYLIANMAVLEYVYEILVCKWNWKRVMSLTQMKTITFIGLFFHCVFAEGKLRKYPSERPKNHLDRILQRWTLDSKVTFLGQNVKERRGHKFF